MQKKIELIRDVHIRYSVTIETSDDEDGGATLLRAVRSLAGAPSQTQPAIAKAINWKWWVKYVGSIVVAVLAVVAAVIRSAGGV